MNIFGMTGLKQSKTQPYTNNISFKSNPQKLFAICELNLEKTDQKITEYILEEKYTQK